VPPIIQFFASIECGFVRQFDSNHGGENSPCIFEQRAAIEYFLLLPICHGHPARSVAYYLKWRDGSANYLALGI
jgi:hypothetical protein